MLWDHETNTETDLPDMPGGVARVYPASGAVAMLPLTPENNYNPTVLFCGGQNLPDDAWGDYSHPRVNTWFCRNRRSRRACSTIDRAQVAHG